MQLEHNRQHPSGQTYPNLNNYLKYTVAMFLCLPGAMVVQVSHPPLRQIKSLYTSHHGFRKGRGRVGERGRDIQTDRQKQRKTDRVRETAFEIGSVL